MDKVKELWAKLVEKVKSHKKVSIACAGAVILVAVIAFVNLNSKAVIDLNDLYEISYSGLNGQATAEVKKSGNADTSKYSEAAFLSKLKSNASKYSSESEYEEKFMSLFSDIKNNYKLNKEDHISNGDKLEATTTFDKKIAKQLNLKIKNPTLKVTVQDLKDGVEVDAFEDLEVTFDGIAPQGTVTIKNNSNDSFVRSITFSSDTEKGLKNGDVINIKASYDKNQAIKELKYLKEDSKEYTVSGLPEYITADTEITDDLKAKIDKEMEDQLVSYISDLTFPYAVKNRLYSIANSTKSEIKERYEKYKSITAGDVSDGALKSKNIIKRNLLTEKKSYSSTPSTKTIYVFEITYGNDNYQFTAYLLVNMSSLYFDSDSVKSDSTYGNTETLYFDLESVENYINSYKDNYNILSL